MYVGFTPTRARGMWLWQRLELRCGMPHHDLAPLQPGLVIDGTYELQTRVGSGGAAEVWLALAPSAVPVAVKFLRSAHDPRLDRLLAREIGHTARLSHPHIVDILAQGVVGEHRYAVLEWMEGGSLSEQLHALTLPDVTQVLRAILGALAHAHGRSLLHLDVKPENIMCATVRPDWRLLDFGIARHLHGGGGLKVAGTPRYMAPEQQHSGPLGPAADLYALGITAWELLHGSPPYRGRTEDVLRKHREGAPRRWNPQLPDADVLRPWIEQLLAVDPAGRPRSAAAALRELEARLGLPLTPPSPSPRHVLTHSRPLMAARGPSVAVETLRDTPVLTGRDALCAQLWAHLRDLRHPDVLWLDGPRGVGRSRLGRWLAETAAEADIASVCTGRSLREALALDGTADDVAVAQALQRITTHRPGLWVCDGLPHGHDLHLVRSSQNPFLVVQSAGPAPSLPHRRVPVPPLDDAAIRRVLIGLLSFHEEAIEELVPTVAGSIGTLVSLIEHLREQGALWQHAFRTHLTGPIHWPARWTRSAFDLLESLRNTSSPDGHAGLDLLAASPPRFQLQDLTALAAQRGLLPPDDLVRQLLELGLLWRDEDTLWWADPLLARRLDDTAPGALLAAWGAIGSDSDALTSALRLSRGGAIDQAVAILADRISADGLAGQVWSTQRNEVALARLAEQGDHLPAPLAARCFVSDLRRQQESGELPYDLVVARLDAAAPLLRGTSPIDTGSARLRSAMIAHRSLAEARGPVEEALLAPWEDPSALVDHMGLLAAIHTAAGSDPTELLLDVRTQLDPALEGPRAWLDVRIAQAMIAAGRPSDAVDRLSLYLHAEGTDWAPAVANMLGEALRLSGQAPRSLDLYARAIRGYLDLGLRAWSTAAVNLACGLGMAGHHADALHLLTAMGRRGSVAVHKVLDTCRVAHVVVNYAASGAWDSTGRALDAYDALAARHEAVDPEQSIAMQLALAYLKERGPDHLLARVQAHLDAMPYQVPNTWTR